MGLNRYSWPKMKIRTLELCDEKFYSQYFKHETEKVFHQFQSLQLIGSYESNGGRQPLQNKLYLVGLT